MFKLAVPDTAHAEVILEDPNGTEGFVLCRKTDGFTEYVTWRYERTGEIGHAVFFHGHYFTEREEALRDLFARAGFGRVEALA